MVDGDDVTRRDRFTLESWQDLRDWLNEQMRQRGWSPADLARAYNRAAGEPDKQRYGMVHGWTRSTTKGNARRPGPKAIHTLAEVFGVDPDYLMSLAGYRVKDAPTDDPVRADLWARIERLDLTPANLRILRAVIGAMSPEAG